MGRAGVLSPRIAGSGTNSSDTMRSRNPSLAPLLLPGGLSLALWALVAFRLGRTAAARDVTLFLGAVALLFGLYVWGWLAGRRHGSVAAVLVFAALFRLAMLPAGLSETRPLEALARDLGAATETDRSPGYDTFLLYDNDVWRYLWEGHVTASGENPYLATPADWVSRAEADDEPGPPLESDLWWDVVENVSFRSHTTVYPPVSQAVFRLAHLLAPGSVFTLKLLLALFDLATCLVLTGLLAELGRPRREVLLYAWNPLVVKEIAGSGHVDSLMVLLLTAAVLLLVRGRHRFAHLALAAAAGAKLAAVALVPLFLGRTPKRTWPALAAAFALVALPFAGSLGRLLDGLAVYARDWEFNSGPWAALRRLFSIVGVESPELWAHLLAKGVILAVVVLGVRRATTTTGTVRAVFHTLAALTLLHPAVMPWYLLWPLPFAVALGNRSWIVLTGTCFLSYLFYAHQAEHAWWLWLEYGAFAVAVAAEARRARRP